MDDVDLDHNVPTGQIFSNVVQQNVTSISKILVGLGRLSMPTSNKSLVHCRAIMDCAN
jgi:hypothetical protein